MQKSEKGASEKGASEKGASAKGASAKGASAKSDPLNFKDFIINAHGEAAPNRLFELPQNVRVIMLCNDGPMTDCTEMSYKLFKIMTDEQGFGVMLENLNTSYEVPIRPGVALSRQRMCVFSPNFNMDYIRRLQKGNSIINDKDSEAINDLMFTFNNGYCPELSISDEYYRFKSGVFHVPASYNRIYLNDYVNSENEFKPAGTVEKLNLQRGVDVDKAYDANLLNKLELLCVKPFPTYIPKKSFNEEYSDFMEEGERAVLENKRYLMLAMCTNTVVVPCTKTYDALAVFEIDDDILLSTIVKKLSLRFPDKICSILVATCRPKYEEIEAMGIPLNYYASDNTIESYLDTKKLGQLKQLNTDVVLNSTFKLEKLPYKIWDLIINDYKLANTGNYPLTLEDAKRAKQLEPFKSAVKGKVKKI